MKYQILNGDNIEILKTLPDNSIDSIITDPPYGIAFLGKDWDHKKATETTTKIAQLHNLPSGMAMTTLADDLEFQYWLRERWIECLRVLKPGGHLLAFSAARTYHHMAMSLQTAGFEIRDQIMWIYSSGFPKSQDVGRSIDRAAGKKQKYTYTKNITDTRNVKNNGTSSTPYCIECDANMTYPPSQCDRQCAAKRSPIETEEAKAWEGWGTALKPAHEPICLARKPTKFSIALNVQRWGTGALNIDATRVPSEKRIVLAPKKGTYQCVEDSHSPIKATADNMEMKEYGDRFPSNVIGEIQEPYQKYFYCPKVSRAERHIGFDLKKVPTIEHNDPATIHLHPLWTPAIGKNVYRLKEAIEKHNAEVPEPLFGNVQGCYDPETGERFAVGLDKAAKGNNHPTVKPVELMKYLIKLVTPPNGKVLDPFNGSGSTGMAAVELGYEYIGIEQDEKYCEISRRRIAAHFKKSDPLRASGLFD